MTVLGTHVNVGDRAWACLRLQPSPLTPPHCLGLKLHPQPCPPSPIQRMHGVPLRRAGTERGLVAFCKGSPRWALGSGLEGCGLPGAVLWGVWDWTPYTLLGGGRKDNDTRPVAEALGKWDPPRGRADARASSHLIGYAPVFSTSTRPEVLKFKPASESYGGLIKTQFSGPHLQSF